MVFSKNWLEPKTYQTCHGKKVTVIGICYQCDKTTQVPHSVNAYVNCKAVKFSRNETKFMALAYIAVQKLIFLNFGLLI